MQTKNNKYRNLTLAEIEQLERQGNYSDDWSSVRVADPFCIKQVRNSTLQDCSIGANATVRDVRLLSGYTLGDNVTLTNIGEMSCTLLSPLEKGSIPDGSSSLLSPLQRGSTSEGGGGYKWLEPMNENGNRRILPFAGMTIGEAYMWARYRGRKRFMERLEQMTMEELAAAGYGQVGDCCVIKNTNCIRNTAILSRSDDPTLVDGALALCDGVVGYGCTVEHGVIAERFLLGEHVHLEFGLRMNDTVVGDNSTLARCEVGNSIIFPAHEQHHNNSFLIAGLIMGQSNIAAGGTIGSNHNSRTADNEIVGGRGFWPGLCCSFKHSSRFASYCLLAKGDYPAELDITLPFALVNNNVSKDRLEIMPAYWWMYNMYAMDRNSKKFAKRDKRVVKAQHIEFDNLAPDTAEEIFRGMMQLRAWIAASTQALPLGKGEYPEGGRGSVVYAQGQEKSKRPTVVLKAAEALKAYEDMLVFYAVRSLESGGRSCLPHPDNYALRTPHSALSNWLNIGGQLITKADMEQLITDVESGVLADWKAVRDRLDTLWEAYPAQREAHAYGILCRLAGVERLDDALWQYYRDRYVAIQQYIEEQKTASRHKDEVNPFRNMTYWDDAEREAVLG